MSDAGMDQQTRTDMLDGFIRCLARLESQTPSEWRSQHTRINVSTMYRFIAVLAPYREGYVARRLLELSRVRALIEPRNRAERRAARHKLGPEGVQHVQRAA